MLHIVPRVYMLFFYLYFFGFCLLCLLYREKVLNLECDLYVWDDTVNNKGSQLDMLYAMVIIVVAVMVLVVSNFLVGSVGSELQDSGTMDNETYNKSFAQVSQSYGLIDSIVPLLFIGSGLGAAVLAYRAPSHPVFAFATVILIVIMLVFSGWLANMYNSVVTDSLLSESAASLSFSGFVMRNLFKLTVGMSFLVMLSGYLGIKGGGR